jgi:hypothetical protein
MNVPAGTVTDSYETTLAVTRVGILAPCEVSIDDMYDQELPPLSGHWYTRSGGLKRAVKPADVRCSTKSQSLEKRMLLPASDSITKHSPITQGVARVNVIVIGLGRSLP